MKARRRGFVNRYLPSKDCKHCDLCLGAHGGVRGNNQLIDGKQVCDYCHARMQTKYLDGLVDTDVLQAAQNYMAYGLPPGSCCMQILLGDLDAAARCCHPVALEVLPNTYHWVRAIVPARARDSAAAIKRWLAHNGLAGTPNRLKPGTLLPTAEEDATITAAALQDPDAVPYTNDEWAKVKPQFAPRRP